TRRRRPGAERLPRALAGGPGPARLRGPAAGARRVRLRADEPALETPRPAGRLPAAAAAAAVAPAARLGRGFVAAPLRLPLDAAAARGARRRGAAGAAGLDEGRPRRRGPLETGAGRRRGAVRPAADRGAQRAPPAELRRHLV